MNKWIPIAGPLPVVLLGKMIVLIRFERRRIIDNELFIVETEQELVTAVKGQGYTHYFILPELPQ